MKVDDIPVPATWRKMSFQGKAWWLVDNHYARDFKSAARILGRRGGRKAQSNRRQRLRSSLDWMRQWEFNNER